MCLLAPTSATLGTQQRCLGSWLTRPQLPRQAHELSARQHGQPQCLGARKEAGKLFTHRGGAHGWVSTGQPARGLSHCRQSSSSWATLGEFPRDPSLPRTATEVRSCGTVLDRGRTHSLGWGALRAVHSQASRFGRVGLRQGHRGRLELGQRQLQERTAQVTGTNAPSNSPGPVPRGHKGTDACQPTAGQLEPNTADP